MYIDLSEMTPDQVYFNLIQTVIPRPIAWVLSENADGSFNLAPFSYFNAVSSDPPLVIISVGKKPDGSFKDSRVNIEERKDFVVHVAHLEMLEALNESSATLPAGVSEVDELGLAITPFEGSRLPRLADSRIAFACECYRIDSLGTLPQSLIFGRVQSIYVDDTVATVNERGRVKVHADKVDPIGRLGANEYMTFGEIRKLVRPR